MLYLQVLVISFINFFDETFFINPFLNFFNKSFGYIPNLNYICNGQGKIIEFFEIFFIKNTLFLLFLKTFRNSMIFIYR